MNREGNYKFSYNKMLSMSGNTAPYLLYAYARIRGIQRQGLDSVLLKQGHGESVKSPQVAASSVSSFDQVTACLDLSSSAELQLAKHLIRFHEVLLEVERTLLPNKVSIIFLFLSFFII
jgi:arginyl-tRNA synthetase